MTMMPASYRYPPANGAIVVRVAYTPSHAWPPWPPAPARPLTASAIITSDAACLGIGWGDDGDCQYPCDRSEFHQSWHRSNSHDRPATTGALSLRQPHLCYTAPAKDRLIPLVRQQEQSACFACQLASRGRTESSRPFTVLRFFLA